MLCNSFYLDEPFGSFVIRNLLCLTSIRGDRPCLSKFCSCHIRLSTHWLCLYSEVFATSPTSAGTLLGRFAEQKLRKQVPVRSAGRQRHTLGVQPFFIVDKTWRDRGPGCPHCAWYGGHRAAAHHLLGLKMEKKLLTDITTFLSSQRCARLAQQSYRESWQKMCKCRISNQD